jgi:erythromycin esterase
MQGSMRTATLVLIAGLNIAFADSAGPPADAAAVKQWLQKDAIRHKTVEAGHGLDDLRPLKQVLHNVRLVGLGEATHGSREFFQMKHRMLEFLVKELGFTVFAIEASYPACWDINDYVLYGKGDRAKALSSQGQRFWDTNEVSDMIDWIRAHNEKAPKAKKVEFVGFDLQNVSGASDGIKAYLNKVAPDYVATADEAFKDLQTPPMDYGRRTVEQKKTQTAHILGLLGFLTLHEMEFARITSKVAFDEVMQEARILAQFDELRNGGGARARDFYMSQNIAYLMSKRPEGTKMVIWAHNSHIQSSDVASFPASFGGGVPSMGSYLRKMYGERYYGFGFTLNEGGLQSREMTAAEINSPSLIGGPGPLKEFTLPPAPEGSVGWYFSLPSIDEFIVDLRAAPKEGPLAQFLSTPHPMTSIGTRFNPSWTPTQYMVPAVLKETFDGIIFIKKTTRARPNAVGMRP